MQNRLTKKSMARENGYVVDNPTAERCSRAIDKLGKYEDAEESGLLVKMPCKVGDTVYPKPSFGHTAPEKVTGIYIYEHFAAIKTTRDSFDFKDFGKKVFLTHEAAMASIKEIRR